MNFNSILSSCTLCPRNCKVDRLNGHMGYCRSLAIPKVSLVSLHHFEEPCISGISGSGTVFFSNCNLGCVFCQNYQISHEGIGKDISIERLSEIFIEEQTNGASNINLVTPTHYVPQIIRALKIAKHNGLKIPILYNTNGYENIETIQALNGYVDVYLPDLKYYNNKYAIKYSDAPDYFKFASNAIIEMVNQVGEPVFNEDGLIVKGVIIRHLMLPGLLFDSKKIIDFIYNTFKDKVFVSIMNQYIPMYKATGKEYSEINKCLNPRHYSALIDYSLSLGIKNGFIQEEGSDSKSFIPDFNLLGT